jgi:hypothetical protein
MKLSAYAASLGSLALVVGFDYATGYELLVHMFYLAPIAIAAWCGGRTHAWAFSVLAAMLWLAVDWLGGHRYSREFYRYWNVAMFFGTFAIFGHLLAWLKETLDATKRLVAEKEAALRQLDESTVKLRELNGSFQTVCAWTNQIKDGEEWIDFQEFLRRRLHVRVSHGLSPEGFKHLRTELPAKPPPPAGDSPCA